jgi:AcrR family transcriptional regulator
MMAGSKSTSSGTIERILLAARTEFAERGFDGARLESAARLAGVTKQLVYHYFKSKEELYAVVLEGIAQDMHAMIDDDSYESLPPEDGVALFASRIIDAYIEHPYLAPMTLDQGLHRGEHVSRRSAYVPTVRCFVAERIEPMLARGAAGGVFRADVDPMLFYWSTFALTSAVFVNTWVMSQSVGIDFDEAEGIERWRSYAIGCVLATIAAQPGAAFTGVKASGVQRRAPSR